MRIAKSQSRRFGIAETSRDLKSQTGSEITTRELEKTHENEGTSQLKLQQFKSLRIGFEIASVSKEDFASLFFFFFGGRW